MNRRRLLQLAAAFPLLSLSRPGAPRAAGGRPAGRVRRVRPSDPDWPSQAKWEPLKQSVGGNLIRVESLVAACGQGKDDAGCQQVLSRLSNPYFIGDQPGGTQTSGWVDAWRSAPSVYAVAARSTGDVVAAVNFARQNRLRLVVKGGGHSYQGTSSAPDSLLIWTRPMDAITLHEAFVGQGCTGRHLPQPAVSVGAGAMWMHVYDAVTTQGGRYVQGGGCGTVGVAGLVQSGGFGSFSKNFGTAAAGLLEAEVVTADGTVRIANPCQNPDLFWGLKGGGGGSLGVVTRLTLRTGELPEFFGGVMTTIRARSDVTFRRLVDRFVGFYAERLFNRHWGESVTLRPNNTLTVSMVFQGLDRKRAEDTWKPFLDWVAASSNDYSLPSPTKVLALPARKLWDAAFLRASAAALVSADDRPDAPANNVWWASDGDQVGVFIHGYTSTWLPDSLLKPEQRRRFTEALHAATRQWGVALHFNKGLAGAKPEALAAAADTATHPAVLTSFALAIIGGGGPPAYPGLPGQGPDLSAARKEAQAIERATAELRKLVPEPGSYVSESNFFEPRWQRAFWGSNYPRLQAVKRKYDPQGLFFVHHGVGSEEWSADGFTPL